MISPLHIRRYRCLLLLPLIPACGPTEVLIGDTPGIARVVAGMGGVSIDPDELDPDSSSGGDAAESPLGAPHGIVALGDGSFYFADRNLRRIGLVSADGGLTWPVGAGVCFRAGASGVDPADLCLRGPTALALSPDGGIVIADEDGNRVYRYDPAAGSVEVVLGTGATGRGPDGEDAKSALTDQPTDVAVDPEGTIYVAERRNHRVVSVGLDGIMRVVAGTGEVGDSGDGGPATEAMLSRPGGVVVLDGVLYISDTGNNRIRRVSDGVITGYSGLGQPGYAGDGGPVGVALYSEPGRLAAIDGLLFVADVGNHRIRLIRVGPDSVTTFAGTGSPDLGVDLLEAGRTNVDLPAGIAGAGRALYFADAGQFVVRRVIR